MIKQIDERYFEEFDSTSGEEKRFAGNSLIIQYAHKIRELVDTVNSITNKLEVNRI